MKTIEDGEEAPVLKLFSIKRPMVTGLQYRSPIIVWTISSEPWKASLSSVEQ